MFWPHTFDSYLKNTRTCFICFGPYKGLVDRDKRLFCQSRGSDYLPPMAWGLSTHDRLTITTHSNYVTLNNTPLYYINLCYPYKRIRRPRCLSVLGDAMLRCLTCADRLQIAAHGQAQRVPGQGEAEKTRHGKMISTMAQLKNCCLGGLRVRQRGRENNDLVIASPRPLFFPFSYLNQLSLSRDIYSPITLID